MALGLGIGLGLSQSRQAAGVAAPVADFTAFPLTGDDPQNVVFTDASTGVITSRLWEKSQDNGVSWSNFSGTPTAQNPTESLSTATWSFQLTLNGNSSLRKTKLNYITINPGA